jgi:ketosteroid isomerase-like protein
MKKLPVGLVAFVLIAGTLLPLEGAAQSASDNPVVQRLLNEARAGTRAWMQGDSKPFSELMAHSDAFTIFGPFGGPAGRWNENFARVQAGAAAQFQGATTSTVDLLQAHVSDRLIVLVLLERSLVRLAGSEPRQWDLRVTQVYERNGDTWKIIHRHADPLVVRRDLAQTLQLFRP